MRAAYHRRTRRFFTMILLTAVLTICLSLSSVVLAGNNKKEEHTYKYYTSVQIEPGDTLWSIANLYCDGAGMEITEYIKEIKRLNHLTSDSITSGQYLTVIYFSTEYK